MLFSTRNIAFGGKNSKRCLQEVMRIVNPDELNKRFKNNGSGAP
jgi:hypothetical protein